MRRGQPPIAETQCNFLSQLRMVRRQIADDGKTPICVYFLRSTARGQFDLWLLYGTSRHKEAATVFSADFWYY